LPGNHIASAGMNSFLYRSTNCKKFCARNTLSLLLLLAAALALQPACGRKHHLRLRLAGDEWFLNPLTDTRMIPEYEQRNGIRVDIVRENDKKIMEELDRGEQEGQAGLDLIVVRHRWLGTLVKKGQVRPLDAFLTDPILHQSSFLPQQQLFGNWWRELSTYENQTYGFPYTGLTTFLCYRKDLLEDAANQREFQARYHRPLKPPTSWQEYTQLAEFFNRPKDGFYGTYIQGKQGLALWYEWLNLIYAFGGNILDTQHGWEYGDIVINSPQNVAATRQYVQLKAFSPPDTLNFGWMEAQSSLQKGTVFMGLLWSDQAPFLEDREVSKVSGKIGYSLIPSAASGPFSQMEGLTYLIPAESKHPREAYKFLEWLISDSVQVEQTLEGSGSLRQSTYDNPEVRKLPYTATFVASIPIAKPKPTIPESDEMIGAMQRRVFEIVSGETPPQAGLDKLALDLKQILGDKAKLHYPVKPR
jgi:multiple sugar transport system substrate-binding protein